MAKFSKDSKIGDLMKDPEAAAILDKYVPGASTNPQVKMGYGMSLKMAATFPQAGIPKDKLAEIDAALQAIGTQETSPSTKPEKKVNAPSDEIKEGAKAISLIPGSRTKLTVLEVQKMKGKQQIVMFCTWDQWLAAAAEMAGCHILRFPSAGLPDPEERANLQPTTVKMLRQVAPNILLNPFIEPIIVHGNVDALIRYAAILMEAGADIMLTLAITPQRVQAMADQRIPVFCHVGLSPTWYTTWTGGYVRVGKTADDALKIFQQAYDYQEAGAQMITVEMTPREVTTEIAKRLRIPVLSIAGGSGGDGAELVFHDLLGISPLDPPKHAKQYRHFFMDAMEALKEFVSDVQTGAYPDPEQHSWSMKPEERERFLHGVEKIVKK